MPSEKVCLNGVQNGMYKRIWKHLFRKCRNAEMQYEYNEFGKLIMATVASISGDHYYFMDGRVETMEIEYPGKN